MDQTTWDPVVGCLKYDEQSAYSNIQGIATDDYGQNMDVTIHEEYVSHVGPVSLRSNLV